jgi:diguanylate cyclase (GGDEF)-like protein/PAS domain S-box-containing protein
MNSRFSLSRSLKTRVTLFTLTIFVVSIWVMALYASRTLREDMQIVLGEQQFSTVKGIAQEIDGRLSDRMYALETIAKEVTPAVLGNQAALQTLLEQRPLLQLMFNGGVFITRTDGIAIADVPVSVGRVGTNYIDRESVSIPLKEGRTVIGRPAMGKKLGTPIFSVTAPLFDNKGQVNGVIVGTINLGKPNFLDQVAQTRYGRSGGYLLFAPQHQLIVTASDKTRVMQAAPAPGVNPIYDRYRAGYEGFGTAVSSRGVLELSAAKGIPSAGWLIVATLPVNEAFAPIDSMLQRLFVGAVIFTLLAGALTWWLMRVMLRQQFAPMLAASRAIAVRSNADHPIQALPVSRDDEIGELIGGFNTLLENYAQREELLKASEAFKDVVLNSMDAEIAVVDHSGVIRAINERWLQFSLGNSPEPGKPTPRTGVGVNYLAVCRGGCGVDTDGALDAHKGLQSVLEGHLSSFNLEYRCDSPKLKRWFSMTAMPLGQNAKGGAVITHRDITRRKQAENALQRSRIMMERTENMVHLASFEWDVDANIVTWSPEMFRIFGRNPALGIPNLQGQVELYTPQSTQALFAAVGKAVSDGTPYELELMTVQPDGEQRPCFVLGFPERDASGRVIRLAGLVQDITRRKQAEAKLQLAASVFSHAREGILITDASGTIIDVNEAFTRITGYLGEEVLGQNPRILKSDRHDKVFYEAMWHALTEQGHWNGEIWNRHKDGEVYAELLTISSVRNADGAVQQYVGLFSDITAIKQHQNQLEHIAHFDALTSLPNRVLLADRLQQAMTQAQRRKRQLAVVYLDLDGFKAINDQHGHDVGDQVLITLAQRMRQCLRDGDSIARLGGDEFVAVLIDLEDFAASRPLLTRLLEACAQPVRVGELSLHVSASLGVTTYPQPQDIDADQLLRQADQAMYQAKLSGKNRYHFFDATQDSSIRGYHESVERIRLALENHEFVLHYQPKVNMESGKIIGAEALIRWQHPQKGLLAPALFLPVIEEHALAVSIGEWVIDTALTQMEIWRAAGLDIAVSVNIGARQLQQSDFVDRLKSILAKHPKVKPTHLELEVLETSALEDIAQVSDVIEACAQIGVTFALDDFGTGYSSLTYLKRLRVAMLKIDQSFVRDMLEDPADWAILQGIIGLATAFKQDVIAEGVETTEHGSLLLQLGCHLAQGYGIARPMPAAQMPKWAEKWKPDLAWSELPWLGGVPESMDA